MDISFLFLLKSSEELMGAGGSGDGDGSVLVLSWEDASE